MLITISASLLIYKTSNKNLIKSKTIHYSNGETETINYTYEFDTNGNPIKVYENGNFSESFLWEL